MARNWVVLTADRAPHEAHEIVGYTEWDGYVAVADEVVYTDPVDADGHAVDARWKVGGSVVLAAGVYTYTDSGREPSLIDRQRSQIFEAYKWWRIFGRTGHWAGLRRGLVDTDGNDTRMIPLDSTDKWAYHVVALMDHAINGTWPITGALSAVALQAALDHAEVVLRTKGPAWYEAQIEPTGIPTTFANNYANMPLTAGSPIYTDIFSVLGVHQGIDGLWTPMSANLRAGFNPEARNLGN